MLRIARPYECATMFAVLEKLHASVVRGPDGNDACLNVLTLKWQKNTWPWAEIVHAELGALITDVCTSSA